MVFSGNVHAGGWRVVTEFLSVKKLFSVGINPEEDKNKSCRGSYSKVSSLQKHTEDEEIETLNTETVGM